MKVYTTDRIRNIVVMGHGGCGKTSLMEMLLHNSGVTTRLGSVDQGTSFCNYDPEEIKRRISIFMKVVPIEWNDSKINFFDTPGYDDFSGEILCGLRPADIGLIVISAVGGIEVQALKSWKMMVNRNMPRAFVINKCDRDGIDFDSVVANLQTAFSDKAVLFQLPINPGANCSGIVDVLQQCAYIYQGDKAVKSEVPAEYKDQIKELKTAITEAAVESDDALLEKYLEQGAVTDEEMKRALRKAISAGKLFPIYCAAATKGFGGRELMDSITATFPSAADAAPITLKDSKGNEVQIKPNAAEPISAFVFKIISEAQLGELAIVKVLSGTVKPGIELVNLRQNGSERIGHLMVIRGKNREEVAEAAAGDILALPKLKNTVINDTLSDNKRQVIFPEIQFPEPVVDFSIKTAARKDQEKLGTAISKVLAADPTIKIQQDPEFNQTIIKGLGDVHIDVTMSKIKERFGIEAVLDKPLIPYRETIKGKSEARYRHKKQSGGSGQFGEVALKVSPRERSAGFEFVDDVVGGVIPQQYIPSCEKGVVAAMKEGVLAGYPVVDISVSVWDGKDHPVDSKDIAFQIAARTAFKMAVETAKPVLLEPIMNVSITVPDKYTGDVTGNLNSRRGRILGIDVETEYQVIKATVPQAEMYKYSGDLRSMTQGTGYYSMKLSHYEEMPPYIAEKVIAESKKRREELREKE